MPSMSLWQPPHEASVSWALNLSRVVAVGEGSGAALLTLGGGSGSPSQSTLRRMTTPRETGDVWLGCACEARKLACVRMPERCVGSSWIGPVAPAPGSFAP